MFKLIKSELYRLIHRKTILAIFLLSVVFSVMFSINFAIAINVKDSTISNSMIAAINYQSEKGPILLNANRLTFSHAVLANVCLFITFIIIPVLTAIIVGDEKASGSLRMIIIRPYSKGKVIASKLITLAIINFLCLVVVFITSQVCALIMTPAVNSTDILLQGHKLNVLQSHIFNVKFYGIFFMEMLALSCLFTIVSSFIKNSVIAVMVDIAIMIASMYLSDFILNFLVSPLTYIYNILAGQTAFMMVLGMVLIFLCTCMVAPLLWNKLDYKE